MVTVYGTNISVVLFEVTPAGVETTLHNFAVGMISDSSLDLVRDSSGNYYGDFTFANDTTGGVWKVTGGGVETDYTLCTTCTYLQFEGPLLLNGGKIYGTDTYGGAFGGGAVYELDPITGIETILYSFPSPGSSTSDGWNPAAGVIMDSAGNLYGTTSGGDFFGKGQSGTVFKLTKN